MVPGSGTLLEAVFACSPDAVLIVDVDGCIESASAAATPLFGYRSDELVGRPVETLVPEDLRAVHHGYRVAYAERPSARPMGVGLELNGRRKDGTIVAIDVSLSPLHFDGRDLTAAFVRDATDRRRSDHLMRNINEITRQVLAGEDQSEVLSLICQRVLSLVGAMTSWLVLPCDADRTQLEVKAAAGVGGDQLVGAALDRANSFSARAMEAGVPVTVADMSSEPSVLEEARPIGIGPGVYFPLSTQDGPMGALVVARPRDADPFSEAEIAAAGSFASAAAVGLELGAARAELEDLHILAEHERIGRDLHDTVIQRLFALGMSLQAAQRLADGPAGERLGDAVHSIDEVIREIRETIFDLNRSPATGSDVRQQVRAVISEVVVPFGLTHRVSFRGPVEGGVPDSVVPHLVSVLREALSNVGRHAKASRVDVVVVATAESVSVSVADDGVGIPDGPSAGNGLANMAERARSLHGELTVSRRRPSGTLVQWQVPTSVQPVA
ncbi:MAG TPA: PAS domain S-box protein [Acidimicrobiales bacterium]|nr:PAS domain S-box protein [Acidimicrobiales bacterium]